MKNQALVQIMKLAHKNARYGKNKFGGKVKDYFSEALKLAYKGIDLLKNSIISMKKGYQVILNGLNNRLSKKETGFITTHKNGSTFYDVFRETVINHASLANVKETTKNDFLLISKERGFKAVFIPTWKILQKEIEIVSRSIESLNRILKTI